MADLHSLVEQFLRKFLNFLIKNVEEKLETNVNSKNRKAKFIFITIFTGFKIQKFIN